MYDSAYKFMLKLMPETAVDAIAIFLILIGIILAGLSFCGKIRGHTLRIAGIGFVLSLALFANYEWTYFAAIFIVATVITELEFLQNLAAIIARDPNYWKHKEKVSRSEIPRQNEGANGGTDHKGLLELKILHTLWALQIFHNPNLEKMITFGIEMPASPYVSPQYADYLMAVGKLMNAKLISQSDNRQVFLTPEGLRYCRDHEREFPNDRWYLNEVPIVPDRRDTLLSHIAANERPTTP